MPCRSIPLLLCGLLVSAAAGGCQHKAEQPPAPEAPVVPAARPAHRPVQDYVDYTGRTAALNAVDVRARVTGYLTELPFKEGAEVKKGDVLFEIDPRPYQASVDAAKAQVAVNQANYNLARANYARDRAIIARDPTALSAQDLETAQAQEAQALANVNLAKAQLRSAELNLGYTRVTSPIDGQISRYYLTLGNLVTADQTVLTNIVSVDPMYVYFDMDERTVLTIRAAINAGIIIPHKKTSDIPVWMGLENESGYPHHGALSFVNNTVNPSTGTMTVRGTFENPKPPEGRRLMSPGMFVRIRLPIGQPRDSLLVTDRAIGFDQGLRFVYVVNAKNQIEYRRVTTGPLEEDGLRVVKTGISASDWVVVGALQQVRPRMTVEPERLKTMPTIPTSEGGQAPPSVPRKPLPPPRRGTPARGGAGSRRPGQPGAPTTGGTQPRRQGSGR